MDVKDIVVGMVGSGGDGVAAAGDILTTSCASEGLHCMMVKSFGPQIRGGESSVRVKISTEPVATQGDILDVLVVLSWADYKKFPGELSVGNETVVITDEKDCPDPLPLENGAKPKEVFKIPFESLVKESGNSRSKNIITLGVLAELFNLPKTGLKKAVEKRFKGKKVEILQSSFKAIDLGIGYAQKNNFKSYLQMNYKPGDVNYVANGNDALSYGALVAGCKFFSSYPITPASEIMEWLSRELPKFGGTMVQAEDEIAAICTVIGASFGGVKSMTATSGPGLSLKMEGIGLACMAEIPVVIVDVQRGGPSTGLPTKTEQSDLGRLSAVHMEMCRTSCLLRQTLKTVLKLPSGHLILLKNINYR